ncbi:glycosyltransferase family 4 protein [Flaviflexus huanghaiensis]|uniref:glycosyltransferase family 4 protein n=1 Tax=Flaviflexus huanghaiensis TaxID=1111473 RepID=UPI0015F95BCE|nr:glycosyltransferase family 4 protein [Flaviflexus huanghaiensis]
MVTKKRRLDGSRSIVYGVTVGVSAYSLLKGQLQWFSTRGWKVTLVSDPDDKALAASRREGVNFEPLSMRRGISLVQDPFSLWCWIRLLRRLSPDATNVGTPKAGLLGGFAAWLTRVPRRVYVVRGLRLEGVDGPLLPVLWLMERLSTTFATDVVVVSESLGRELVRRRLTNPKKTWLIGSGSSNGVDVEKIEDRVSATDAGQLRSDLGISADSFVVGFIGRVNRDKGFDTLVRAMTSGELAEHVRLLVIGPVEDTALAGLLGSQESRVIFIEWTNDVWAYLSVIDTLVLPTRREGFPNVVLEAASARVPTITTRATGATDSVLDGETGYQVDIDDSVALTRRINQFAATPELAREMGQRAYERVRTEFKPESIWQGLAEIIEGRAVSEHVVRLEQPNVTNRKS